MDYEQAYKELIQQRRLHQAAYRQRHKAEINAYFKIWYQKNKKRMSARRRAKYRQQKESQLNTDPSPTKLQ